MERDYLNSIPLIKVEFISGKERGIHFHENVELLYVLHGKMDITVEEETFTLFPDDIIVVNSNKNHSFNGSKNLFIGRFIISYEKICELLEKKLILFCCNSVTDKNEAYTEMRNLITQIFNQYLQTDANNRIYLQSLYYQLLHVLTSNFLLTEKDIRFEVEKSDMEDRMSEIMQFIRSNYYRSITLQDLADKFYLTKSYLSKYIIKKCNISFIDLLTTIRLNHAMDELTQSNSSMMNIAMKNGFASVAAFNKAFKEVYHTTPSEFRKRLNLNAKERNNVPEENNQQLIEEKVNAYLVRKPDAKMDISPKNELDFDINISNNQGTHWNRNGNTMINIGTASDLSRSVFRDHLLYLKENLGFQYVRFWDIYSADMFLDIHATGEQLNFGRLDNILDFLMSNHLKPYFELGFKPLRLLKNTSNSLLEIPSKDEFYSLAEMENFYYEMMVHFVKRYGADEVETWYFELWKKEDIIFVDNSFQYTPLSSSHTQDYLQKFAAISRGMKRCVPSARIGGGGFSVQHYGKEGLQTLFHEWKKIEYLPDFVSLNCFPYQLQKDENKYFEKKSTDMFFLKHKIEIAREAMAEFDLQIPDLHVSEFSLTLSNRNAINDSCQKGAFLIQTLISTIGDAEIIGYWVGSDMYADYHDTQNFIFGGCGLVTKTGIPKPAFYAFKFIQMLYKNLIQKDKNFIITNNGRGAWRIACHNFKNFNYNYYLSEEDKIQVKEIPYMIEDKSRINFHYTINSVENGTYTLKIYTITTEYGSIQNELDRLQLESNLTMDEQDYLRRICTPRLSTQKYTVENQTLNFSISLEPNEIRFIHVTYHQ